MLWRVNFYSMYFAFGLSVLLILAGSQYADKISPDIENFLEKTRSKIKYQLSTYNFSETGAHELKDLVMETGGRPLQILIISTWRSGTKFFGDLLNAIPGTYYHYEPLHMYGIKQIRGQPESDQALSTIRAMMKCKYKGLKDYLKHESDNWYQFNYNARFCGKNCSLKYVKGLRLDANFTSRLCKLFPFHTIKVVRLRLHLVQEILDDKELNVKVLFLVRDPRGVMQSRLHCDFCKSAWDCRKPSFVCGDMISDYVAAGRIQQQYSDRLMVLRFEELALKPNITTRRILKFLRLSATQSIDKFLQTRTKLSRNVPFKWKSVMQFKYVDEIQMACKDAMLLWGYKMACNVTHMKSKHFDPIENYTIAQFRSVLQTKAKRSQDCI